MAQPGDTHSTALSDQFSESSAYSIKLEKFEGPLDLLLFLIKKNELNICDIPIALITRQYLEYIQLLKELNLEIAGDFLVMASTLIQIKSSMLLPVHAEEERDEESDDPRAELVRRLLEYSKYKDAAQQLQERKILGRDFYARTVAAPDLDRQDRANEPVDVELFALIEAFRIIAARAPRERFHEVGAETISIAERINEILSHLQEHDSLQFEQLFDGSSDRDYLVATFLAVLELCRLKLIRVRQFKHFSPIVITSAVPGSLPVDGSP